MLGAASEVPLPVAALPKVLHAIGGNALSPTADVIAGRAAALVAGGLLVEALTLGGTAAPSAGASWALATSETGRRHARDLMCRPGPAAESPLGMVTDRLWLCLLDLLGPGEREVVLSRLETARRERLIHLRQAAARCPYGHVFMRRWLAHEVERLDAELGWIGTLASGT